MAEKPTTVPSRTRLLADRPALFNQEGRAVVVWRGGGTMGIGTLRLHYPKKAADEPVAEAPAPIEEEPVLEPELEPETDNEPDPEDDLEDEGESNEDE